MSYGEGLVRVTRYKVMVGQVSVRRTVEDIVQSGELFPSLSLLEDTAARCPGRLNGDVETPVVQAMRFQKLKDLGEGWKSESLEGSLDL